MTGKKLPILPGQNIPHAPRPYAQALADILAPLVPLSAETVDILAAAGRVLAEDVTAQVDLPPWDNSAMDGYALRASTTSAKVPLQVAFTVAAGALPGEVEPGKVARIMTGAPVPAGADAVIMREEVDETHGDTVTFERTVAAGENIRRKGEDVAAGSVVMRAGSVVTPAGVGLLAGVGRARVRVRRAPVVAILSTGDELSEVGTPPHPGRIYNSNAWMLAAQVSEAGGIPRVLGIAPDTRAALVDRLKEARGADVLVTIGGVSVGDFDFVKDALEDVGARLDFWRVAIRPGKPLAVGRLGETLVYGLPGNPVSSFVTFEVFVRPALRTLLGFSRPHRAVVKATLTENFRKKPGLTHFIRVNLEEDATGVLAQPRLQQSSGALSSIAGADGLMVLEEDRGDVTAGETVQVMVLADGWRRGLM
jgi:molybdopterin molybdotransferase